MEFPKHPVMLGPNEPKAWNDVGIPTAGLGYTYIYTLIPSSFQKKYILSYHLRISVEPNSTLLAYKVRTTPLINILLYRVSSNVGLLTRTRLDI